MCGYPKVVVSKCKLCLRAGGSAARIRIQLGWVSQGQRDVLTVCAQNV